jgi:hypothetical protein
MRAAVAMRAQVDANALKSPVQSTVVLAPMAGQGIDVIGVAAAVVTDAALSRRIFALYATLQFNEGTLLQRGTGEQALKDGKLPPAPFALLARAGTLQTTFGKLFRRRSISTMRSRRRTAASSASCASSRSRCPARRPARRSTGAGSRSTATSPA